MFWKVRWFCLGFVRYVFLVIRFIIRVRLNWDLVRRMGIYEGVEGLCVRGGVGFGLCV